MTRSEEVLDAIDAFASANRLDDRDLATRILVAYALSELGYLSDTPAGGFSVKRVNRSSASGL